MQKIVRNRRRAHCCAICQSSGKLSPTKVNHLDKALISHCTEVIDAGTCSAGIESTIIDARNEAPVILRTGPITNLDIKTQTNMHCVYPKSKQGNSPIAPGQLEAIMHHLQMSELMQPIRRKGKYLSVSTLQMLIYI